MGMRLAVALVTALILIVVGALNLLIMLPGMNVYGASTWTIILIGSSVLVLIAIAISSVVSGLLAHAIQTRSGMSPWVVGPMVVVAVTAVSIIAIFLIGIIIVGVVDSTRKRPRGSNHRRLTGVAGDDRRIIRASCITPGGLDYVSCARR